MSNPSADAANSISSLPIDISLDQQVQQLATGTLRQQLAAISGLAQEGESGRLALIQFVRSQLPQTRPQDFTVAVGKAYQTLLVSDSALVQSFLSSELSQGPFALPSERGIDYRELQQLLAQQSYEAADRLTLQKLCELASPDAVRRGWVYFTEIDAIPAADLLLIDRLWRVYSEDRFGFSRQREIWLGVNQNWERLWQQLAWKTSNIWTRYPGEFDWSVTAPIGHLPLSNQLRGVRTIASLFAHPAWAQAAAAAD